MAIFNSYVKLPEGSWEVAQPDFEHLQQKQEFCPILGPPRKRRGSRRTCEVIWLVVYLPFWKKNSQLGLLFPIYGKIKHVPNHQPVMLQAQRRNSFCGPKERWSRVSRKVMWNISFQPPPKKYINEKNMLLPQTTRNTRKIYLKILEILKKYFNSQLFPKIPLLFWQNSRNGSGILNADLHITAIQQYLAGPVPNMWWVPYEKPCFFGCLTGGRGLVVGFPIQILGHNMLQSSTDLPIIYGCWKICPLAYRPI